MDRVENKISENSVATKQRGNAVPTLSDPQQGMYQSNVISNCDSSVPFRTGLLAITSINPPRVSVVGHSPVAVTDLLQLHSRAQTRPTSKRPRVSPIIQRPRIGHRARLEEPAFDMLDHD